jgi:hypothetical protein
VIHGGGSVPRRAPPPSSFPWRGRAAAGLGQARRAVRALVDRGVQHTRGGAVKLASAPGEAADPSLPRPTHSHSGPGPAAARPPPAVPFAAPGSAGAQKNQEFKVCTHTGSVCTLM